MDAALKLIAEHGVSGTSLQMIADAMGVTKAAVYHQFKTKEEIVIAITEREMSRLEDVLEAAEAEGHSLRARAVLLDRMIEQAIDRRGAFSIPMFDPVIIRLQAEYEPFQRFIERLYAALLGTEAGVEARLHAAMLSSAISVAVMHPLLADVDGDTLRAYLKEMTRRMIGLPEWTEGSMLTRRREHARSAVSCTGTRTRLPVAIQPRSRALSPTDGEWHAPDWAVSGPRWDGRLLHRDARRLERISPGSSVGRRHTRRRDADRATGPWFVQEVGQRAEGTNLTIAGSYHDKYRPRPARGSSCAAGTTRCCAAPTAR